MTEIVSQFPDDNHQDMLDDLNQRINKDSRDQLALFERAKLFVALKKYPEALEDASAAVVLQRRWVEIWVLRAEIFALLKDYDSALVNYDVATKLDLRRAATYWSRARLYEYLALQSTQGRNDPNYRERQGRLALADYAMALKLDAQNRSYIRARARLCRELGHYEQAIADYNHWLELEPDNLSARANRAELCTRLARNAEALEDYTFLLQQNPTSLLYEKRGLLYKAAGEYQLALKDLRYALELSGTTPRQRLSLHQVRADIFRQMGLKQRTIEELQQLVPLEEELFGSSAVTLEKIRKLEQELESGNTGCLGADCLPMVPADQHPSVVHPRAQIQADPRNPAGFYRRGLAYFDLKVYTKALADFEYALGLDPDYEWARFGRGRVYAARGQTERARDEWLVLGRESTTGSLRNAVQEELARYSSNI